MSEPTWTTACPIGAADVEDRILLAHGEGGRLMRRLLQQTILPALAGDGPRDLEDAARLPAVPGPLAFTTDSFVVSPLFFPGGDIGTLAVYGTVNDLVVSGARPLWLSLSLILEEGLPLAVLERVIRSISAAATVAGVQIAAGDTKVVPRGAADQLFINTSGIGQLWESPPPGAGSLLPGDELVISGPIGRHGIAVLASRENLGFEPPPESDCAPLIEPAARLRDAGIPVRAMRDATRGGVAAVLHEWAEASGITLTIDEHSLPITPDVRGACELLGLDPLHVANEGTMLVAVAAGCGAAAVAALRQSAISAGAALIGQARPQGLAPATVRRVLGTEQPLDEPQGSPLPRIC
ncbi:MAG: hydrogenase expression/formation protein HypE [Planctomycetales bacterium]